MLANGLSLDAIRQLERDGAGHLMSSDLCKHTHRYMCPPWSCLPKLTRQKETNTPTHICADMTMPESRAGRRDATLASSTQGSLSITAKQSPRQGYLASKPHSCLLKLGHLHSPGTQTQTTGVCREHPFWELSP